MNHQLRLFKMAIVAAIGLGVICPASGDTNGWVTSRVTFALDINVVNVCNGDEHVHLLGTGTIVTNTKVQDGTIKVRELTSLPALAVAHLDQTTCSESSPRST